jgi:hypothetical protein
MTYRILSEMWFSSCTEKSEKRQRGDISHDLPEMWLQEESSGQD